MAVDFHDEPDNLGTGWPTSWIVGQCLTGGEDAGVTHKHLLFALPARRVLMLRAALLHVNGWPVRIQTRLRPIRSAEHD